MHITEGIITGTQAVLYTAAGITLVGYGTTKMKKFVSSFPEKRPLLGMAGALIFFISLLPIPAFTGTSSHPCGTPFIAILFGPAIAIALTGASLLLQAAFFAHGGFGTWGANVVALGLLGCLAGWWSFHLARKIGLPLWAAGFAGGLIGDVAVYMGSGFILANALINAPTPQYSFGGYLTVIYGAYLPTQLPIAVAEMVITGLALYYIYKQRPEVLVDLGLAESISARPKKSVEITTKSLFLTTVLLVMSADHAVAANDAGEHGKLKYSTIQMRDSSTLNSFTGMDEAVNEKLAGNAGLEPKDPLINTESMGDLWNALLLMAGGVCGFILGRWWNLISNTKKTCENQKQGVH
jgi:cobalt/nickel transport system permease protein